MCKKFEPGVFECSNRKTAMAAATGREIKRVMAFTLIVSKQSGKGNRKDLIQPNIPVKIWAEVTKGADFAVRPIIKEPGKKPRSKLLTPPTWYP